MLALHEFIRCPRHIVAQVVKTKFVVGTVGEVSFVGIAARQRIGLMAVDAVHAHAVELKQGCIPFGVTLSQVVVHGHNMYPQARQRIQEGR